MPNSPMLLRLSAETPEAGPTLHPAVVEQASSHILFSPHGLHCPVLCSEVLYYFISLIPKQKCYLKSCILNWTSQKVALDLFLEAVVLKLQGAVRRDVARITGEHGPCSQRPPYTQVWCCTHLWEVCQPPLWNLWIQIKKKILDLLEYYKLSLKAQAIFLERIQ